MKKILLPLGTMSVAGAVALSLLGTPATAADGQDDVAYYKREDKAGSLVLAAADDDDDDNAGVDRTRTSTRTGGGTQTRTRTRTGHGTGTNGTGSSRSGHDGTNSRITDASRNRDRSHGDLTRDFTRDGGTHTRDLTPNLTNDRSRNDTRGRG